MARTTPAQKPRGEHSSTFSGGLRSVPGAWGTVVRTSVARRRSRHSTWPYALLLSSDPRDRNFRPNANDGHRRIIASAAARYVPPSHASWRAYNCAGGGERWQWTHGAGARPGGLRGAAM